LSFAGRIAGIASRLPLGFQGGFPRGPLSEFRIARLLLGLQAGLTSGSLGKLRGHLSALTIWTHSQGVYPLRNASTMGASPAKHLIGLCQEVPPFALDSQLEGEGFEPSVPRVMEVDLGRQVPALIAVFELAGTAVTSQRGTKCQRRTV